MMPSLVRGHGASAMDGAQVGAAFGASGIHFYKGRANSVGGKAQPIQDEEACITEIGEKLTEIVDARHLSFLLGAGCSSLMKPDEQGRYEQVGIPTMQPLAREFLGRSDAEGLLGGEDKEFLRRHLGIDVTQPPFATNLEKFLEVLFSFRFVLEQNNLSVMAPANILPEEPSKTAAADATTEASRRDHQSLASRVDAIIARTKDFILERCLAGAFATDSTVLDVYRAFYRKLIYRTSTLSKPNIFTTNYDLFSEKALDSLGVIFSNGFTGVIDRHFNPAVFNYAFAERIDTSSRKWNAIENYIYLYKLHGSVNWVEDPNDGRLFAIRELQRDRYDDLRSERNLMIYPSPLKQNASLGSPYADLFREFQAKLMREQNVLVTVGYSFSDEHINHLIFQALTIPTFRLVVLADHSLPQIAKLIDLDDPRIWVICGETSEGRKVHYFDFVVERLLPSLSERRIEESVDKAIKNLIRKESRDPR